jgi:hypothetical protein
VANPPRFRGLEDACCKPKASLVGLITPCTARIKSVIRQHLQDVCPRNGKENSDELELDFLNEGVNLARIHLKYQQSHSI